ncbi:MAG TPA: single-stranded DNA-binding protein [Dehalococcoidia bacterium]|nr:single-stranded DNA-binding protein [Chloroflexota bacterium]HIB10938.1 single-stranded DNA-binding protein [Dehalococcoidia bacterium]
MNKIIVIGNLGRDPEMRYTPNGQSVTSFSVASNRKYTTAAGEQREETEWFNVSAWGRHAELCNQYLTKGQQVYVEGRLHSRTYETRDGQTRFVNEINLTDVQFLSRGAEMGGEASGYAPGPGPGMGDEGPPMDDVDDLPF